MFGSAKKSALLIDFDNVIGMTSGAFAASIQNWMAWLEDGGFDPKRHRRRFAVKRVYWNGLNERYRPAFEAAGFEAFACRAIAKDKKSSADIVMTLDAVDIASETKGLKEMILLTSDTDFVPVVNRLQDRKLEVAAMGNEENATAAVYRDYADHVVLRSEFMAAFTYERPRRGLFANTPKPARKAAAPKPAPASNKKLSPFEDAAERVVRAAKGALGAPLSRQSVYRALDGAPGFSPRGADPWFGHGSYKGLLKAIADARKKELRLHAFRNGGVAIAYVSSEGA